MGSNEGRGIPPFSPLLDGKVNLQLGWLQTTGFTRCGGFPPGRGRGPKRDVVSREGWLEKGEGMIDGQQEGEGQRRTVGGR